MQRISPLAAMVLGALATSAYGDSVQLIPSARNSATHCLGPNSSGYVAGFDGKVFEIFTVMADCGGVSSIPARCTSMLRGADSAPRELLAALGARQFQLVRHMVPVDEVIGIRFDDMINSVCSSDKPKFEKKTGPLMQPTTFQPITEPELRSYGIETNRVTPGSVVDADWTAWLKEKQDVKVGDFIQFEFKAQANLEELKSNSERKVFLAGKRAATGTTEDLVIISGELVGSSPNYRGIQVDAVVQSQTMRQLVSNQGQQLPDTLATLRPARVLNKKSAAGGFNWEAEIAPTSTLQLRLLRIESGANRTIEVESNAVSGSPGQLRSVRRMN